MRTVVIGANGQLGSDLRRLLPGEVVALDVPDFDLRQEAQTQAELARWRPDWVINCAALTNVDECEQRPAECFELNAVGALIAARCGARVGAAVAYVSTDYVFGMGGVRAASYCEDDLPGPVNAYGASKLAGESLTLAYCEKALIVRTCGLYGHAGARGKGGNFVETMLRLGRAGEAVRVVDDQRLSPTATSDCAAKLVELLRAEARGIVHVAARDTCTWFELAREVFAVADMEVDLQPVASSQYVRPARRPVFSALASRRLAGLGLEPCRTWREMLADYMAARGGRTTALGDGAGQAGCGRGSAVVALEVRHE